MSQQVNYSSRFRFPTDPSHGYRLFIDINLPVQDVGGGKICGPVSSLDPNHQRFTVATVWRLDALSDVADSFLVLNCAVVVGITT